MFVHMGSPVDTTAAAVQAWQKIRPNEELTGLAIRMRIQRLDAIAHEHLAAIVSDYGFSIYGDYQLVGALRRHPEKLHAGEIAELLMLTPAGVTGRLQRLEQSGFVSRAASTKDARRVLVGCTPLGRRRVDKAFAAIREYDERLLEPLTGREAGQLSESLRKLLAPHDTSDA